MTDSNVIVRVERLEDFGGAVATGCVDDLVCGELASLRQFLASRFQPNLRLTMIDLLCVQLGAFHHGAILPLRTRLLTHLPSPRSSRNLTEITKEGMMLPLAG